MNDLQLFAITIVSAIFLLVFALTTPRILNAITYQILKFCIRTPAKNTVTGNTPKQRVREFKCRQLGCVTTASYYIGMPQATCRRCGHKNACAQPQVPEWSEPD